VGSCGLVKGKKRTVQYSAVQCSAVQCSSVVHYSTVQYILNSHVSAESNTHNQVQGIAHTHHIAGLVSWQMRSALYGVRGR
jgi:hypothetical protein